MRSKEVPEAVGPCAPIEIDDDDFRRDCPADSACGYIVHQARICTSSITASLKPRIVSGFLSALTGKTARRARA